MDAPKHLLAQQDQPDMVKYDHPPSGYLFPLAAITALSVCIVAPKPGSQFLLLA